jgi:hypothetical protein
VPPSYQSREPVTSANLGAGNVSSNPCRSCMILKPQLTREKSLVRHFDQIARNSRRNTGGFRSQRIPQFESDHPSQAVGLTDVQKRPIQPRSASLGHRGEPRAFGGAGRCRADSIRRLQLAAPSAETGPASATVAPVPIRLQGPRVCDSATVAPVPIRTGNCNCSKWPRLHMN